MADLSSNPKARFYECDKLTPNPKNPMTLEPFVIDTADPLCQNVGGLLAHYRSVIANMQTECAELARRIAIEQHKLQTAILANDEEYSLREAAEHERDVLTAKLKAAETEHDLVERLNSFRAARDSAIPYEPTKIERNLEGAAIDCMEKADAAEKENMFLRKERDDSECLRAEFHARELELQKRVERLQDANRSCGDGILLRDEKITDLKSQLAELRSEPTQQVLDETRRKLAEANKKLVAASDEILRLNDHAASKPRSVGEIREKLRLFLIEKNALSVAVSLAEDKDMISRVFNFLSDYFVNSPKSEPRSVEGAIEEAAKWCEAKYELRAAMVLRSGEDASSLPLVLLVRHLADNGYIVTDDQRRDCEAMKFAEQLSPETRIIRCDKYWRAEIKNDAGVLYVTADTLREAIETAKGENEMTTDRIAAMIHRNHDGTLTERQRVERGLKHAERQIEKWEAMRRRLKTELGRLEAK